MLHIYLLIIKLLIMITKQFIMFNNKMSKDSPEKSERAMRQYIIQMPCC